MCSIFCGASVNIIEINMPNLEGKPQPPKGKSKTVFLQTIQFISKVHFLVWHKRFLLLFYFVPHFFFFVLVTRLVALI